jgi:hypothetical protein
VCDPREITHPLWAWFAEAISQTPTVRWVIYDADANVKPTIGQPVSTLRVQNQKQRGKASFLICCIIKPVSHALLTYAANLLAVRYIPQFGLEVNVSVAVVSGKLIHARQTKLSLCAKLPEG